MMNRQESNSDFPTPPAGQGQPPATNFSSRFVSSYYPQTPINTSKATSPSSQQPNPFSEHQMASSGSQSQNRTSRASTVNGQNYAINPSAMPTSPPQQSAQPILAQHSGYAGYGRDNPSLHSRPVSRSAASQAPPTNFGPMPSRPAQNPANDSRPTSSRSPFHTPITAPPRHRPYQILLINPNSSRSMTDSMILAVRPSLPTGIELTGYTAPYPAPTAIESITDAIMSTEAVVRDLAKYAASNGETVQNFDGMIVACYSKHPLIDALHEGYDVPVVGIMEASLYTARMLGGRFGIVATGSRSKFLQDDAIAAYGLGHFYVGSEATHLGVLELETRSREEVAKRVQSAARVLVGKGADTILLGCAGMTELVRVAKDAVRDEDGRRTVNIIEGVEAGVMMMGLLVGLGVPTSKKGIYKGERDGRRGRGQNWL